MKKYWATIKIGFKNALAYRADFFVWGFNEFLDTLIFLFIWIVIFDEKNKIGGFSLPETITYLIGVGLITNIISSWVFNHIERDVQSGWLSNLLIKPASYPFSRLFLSLSSKPVNLTIRTIIYLGLAMFFRDKLVITTSPQTIILVAISIFLAFIINYLLDFSTGCIAFWTTTTQGISAVLNTIKSIFSGAYAPLAFFPPWFQLVARFLPFAYTRYFPMLIYLKKVNTLEAIEGIGIQIIWIIVLYFVSRLVWTRGVRRYEGVGI